MASGVVTVRLAESLSCSIQKDSRARQRRKRSEAGSGRAASHLTTQGHKAPLFWKRVELHSKHDPRRDIFFVLPFAPEIDRSFCGTCRLCTLAERVAAQCHRLLGYSCHLGFQGGSVVRQCKLVLTYLDHSP